MIIRNRKEEEEREKREGKKGGEDLMTNVNYVRIKKSPQFLFALLNQPHKEKDQSFSDDVDDATSVQAPRLASFQHNQDYCHTCLSAARYRL